MTARHYVTIFALTLLPLAACGGGGGGAPGGGGSDLNQGSYDKGAFGYQDPYPEEFQPLRSKDFRAACREEIAVLFASGTTTPYAACHDDAGQQYKRLGLFGPSLFDAGFAAVASATGSLDPDVSGDELVVIGRRGDDLEMVVLTTDSKGQWTRIGRTRIEDARGLSSAKIATANLDGDEQDEVVVAAVYSWGGWVRVYDDPQGNSGLMYTLDLPDCERLQAMPFDADLDGVPEILVFRRGVDNRALVRLVESSAKNFAFRGEWIAVDSDAREVVVGNFDADPAPELGVVTRSEARIAHAKTYELTGSEAKLIESTSAPLGRDTYAVGDTVAVDTDGDKVDEIATMLLTVVYPKYGGSLVYWVPSANRAKHGANLMRHAYEPYPRRASLAAFDADADGREELAVVTELGNDNLWTGVWHAEEENGVFRLEVKTLGNERGPGGVAAALVAPGDFDRENLVLRSTGRKWLDLPDPMPVVVMAAPPTKSGIRQNYAASSTSYGTEQSTEHSHGVTTGLTASFSTGHEASAFFGLFTASVKQTLTWEMEKSLTRTTKVTWTKTFAGSHDKDVIIFQGTLYQVYEYEIVGAADAELIGARITLNDPVATKTYKWTVDFYNQTVAARARIGGDVLTHGIGDPASYRRRATAQSLLQQRYGWIDAGLEVGAGGGSNGTSVTISNANSTETSRRFGVDWESELKIGGAMIGGSFGLTREEIYEVSVETGTSYEGEVGDIESSDDWTAWRYSFGLLVYRHGADAKGRPERGKRPFHVITYWVDDLGPRYRD